MSDGDNVDDRRSFPLEDGLSPATFEALRLFLLSAHDETDFGTKELSKIWFEKELSSLPCAGNGIFSLVDITQGVAICGSNISLQSLRPNDAAIPDWSKLFDFSLTESARDQAWEDYSEHSRLGANMTLKSIQPLETTFVALKDIKAHEELFRSYNGEWLIIAMLGLDANIMLLPTARETSSLMEPSTSTSTESSRLEDEQLDPHFAYVIDKMLGGNLSPSGISDYVASVREARRRGSDNLLFCVATDYTVTVHGHISDGGHVVPALSSSSSIPVPVPVCILAGGADSGDGIVVDAASSHGSFQLPCCLKVITGTELLQWRRSLFDRVQRMIQEDKSKGKSEAEAGVGVGGEGEAVPGDLADDSSHLWKSYELACEEYPHLRTHLIF